MIKSNILFMVSLLISLCIPAAAYEAVTTLDHPSMTPPNLEKTHAEQTHLAYEHTLAIEAAAPLFERITSIIQDIEPQDQNPELFNGCEVTSLSMLLTAAGSPVGKLELASRLDKDSSPLLREDDHIVSWGDPDKGFVGDVEGVEIGYGVYHAPIAKLLNEILPGQAVDLTGQAFERIVDVLNDHKPIIVWTNEHFSTETEWVTWDSDSGPIRATWNEHVVLLVGIDTDYVYLNDPSDGTAAKVVNKDDFIESWLEMGSQAVTYSRSA
ncbi:Uncharacterized protein YvpB [Paenibacillus sp. 1_12]|uniref:C39 family peptidase n=1 Tax=Paenibacillus sp. 1_12 TaxID=1566278 RepID=UPI0008E066E4|nr:C39 family peptidase [Paenibacillus sp. 1_12]SFL53383.1 Uncharacterized protein YvpB [Paenibacillus sp. 1_12]